LEAKRVPLATSAADAIHRHGLASEGKPSSIAVSSLVVGRRVDLSKRLGCQTTHLVSLERATPIGPTY